MSLSICAFLSLLQLLSTASATVDSPTCSALDWSCNPNLFKSIDFWRTIALGIDLHVVEKEQEILETHDITDDRAEHLRDKMRRDGYFKFNNFKGDRIRKESQNFVKLYDVLHSRLGLPATFLAVYDEMWDIISALVTKLEPLTGATRKGELFIFNVKPGAQGWEAHRDGESGDWIISFNKEAPYQNISLWNTAWLPLTESTLETSSMYCLPAFVDPEYADLTHPTGKDEDMDYEDQIPTKQILVENHRHIRALPVPVGTALVWSHRLLHWSSTPPEDAPHARLALSFGMTKSDSDQPLLENDTVFPNFEQRLALLSFNSVHYSYNFHTPPSVDILYQLLSVLSDPKFANELTEHALCETPDIWMSIHRMYFDEDKRALREMIVAFARYVYTFRGFGEYCMTFATVLVKDDKEGLEREYQEYLEDGGADDTPKESSVKIADTDDDDAYEGDGDDDDDGDDEEYWYEVFNDETQEYQRED